MFGLGPWYWGEVKAIAGCDGDNVKGIKGVGETFALKYLKGELSGKKFEDIEKSKGVIERNRKLVHLPFRWKDKIPDCKIDGEEVFKKKNFIDVFTEYDFVSFLRKEKFSKWLEIFLN